MLPTRLTECDVVLTRTDPTDVDRVLAAVTDSIVELGAVMPWAEPDYGRDDAMDFLCRSWMGWNQGTQYDFLITRRGSDRMLGTCGLSAVKGGQANLGYWTRTGEEGQGLATTAARLVARFGFEHVRLRRIHLHHLVDNHGSRRVAEKVGFVREGTFREVLVLHDRPRDATFYSLLGVGEITGDGSRS